MRIMGLHGVHKKTQKYEWYLYKEQRKNGRIAAVPFIEWNERNENSIHNIGLQHDIMLKLLQNQLQLCFLTLVIPSASFRAEGCHFELDLLKALTILSTK